MRGDPHNHFGSARGSRNRGIPRASQHRRLERRSVASCVVKPHLTGTNRSDACIDQKLDQASSSPARHCRTKRSSSASVSRDVDGTTDGIVWSTDLRRPLRRAPRDSIATAPSPDFRLSPLPEQAIGIPQQHRIGRGRFEVAEIAVADGENVRAGEEDRHVGRDELLDLVVRGLRAAPDVAVIWTDIRRSTSLPTPRVAARRRSISDSTHGASHCSSTRSSRNSDASPLTMPQRAPSNSRLQHGVGHHAELGGLQTDANAQLRQAS